MANKDINMRVKYSAEFDTSKVSEGLKEIRKQMSNSHIGEDLRKQLETALNKVEVNIPALEKMAGKGEYNSKELEAFQKTIQQVSKDMLALDKLASEADFTKAFSEADTNKLKNFEKQLSEVENKLKSTRKEILNAFSNSNQGKIGGKSNATLNGFIEQLISVPPDEIENKFDEIIKEAENQADNAVEKLKQDFATKANKNKVNKKDFLALLFGEDSGVTFKEGKTLDNNKDNTKIGARTVYNQIREEILALKEDANSADIKKILDEYKAFVEEYFNVPEGKQSVLGNITTPEVVERLKQLSENIPELRQALGEEGLKILEEGEAEKLKITQEQAALLKQRLDELVQTKILTVEQAKAVQQALGGMNKKVEEGSEQIQREKTQADALSATFGSLAHRITNSISALTIFNRSIQIIRQAVTSVRELDAAFTQIAIVSEQTNEQAWQMFDSFNKLAKQYSITTKDLAEGAKLFYQQGLNAADTMKMVEASTISAALGEVTMTEAANTLTAAIQGYNESAEVAMDYTDKIAMVGAVSAADFNELSAAMEKTASSAYTAGIDFDHLLGYLGKMIEVTREAPANLGTAMKTIIARFEDMKKDPNALIDGASANKVESALATIGIALRDAAGEFRPLQDVFDELGMKWDTLTRNQQAYIATVAAGSRQQSRFLAMMNNYDRTLELVRESQDSAGAALKQYETYQDSAAAATARLTAAWEEFYSKIVSSNMITNAINSLTKLVETMSKIGPIWSTIIATIGAHSINKIIKSNLISKIINFFGEEIKTADGDIFTVTIANVFKNGISLGLKKGLNKFDNSTFEPYRNALIEAGQLGTEKGILKGLGKAGTGVGSALSKIVSVAGPILAGVAIAAVLAAITLAITKTINFVNEKEQRWLKQSSEEVKKNREKINEYKEEKKAIEDNYEVYKKYNKQIILTEEELKEQNNAVNNIQEQYKDLIVVTDELGRKNILNTEQLEKHTEELKNQTLELEKQNALKKYEATNPSFAQKRKYGNSDEYMKDWTVTQLTNVGYTEQEAQILDLYGEMKRNPNNKGFFKNTPDSFSLYDRINADLTGGIKDNNLDRYIKTITKGSYDEISKLLDELRNREENTPEVFEELKEYYQTVEYYAENAIKALDILNSRSGEYAKTLLNLNLNNINDSFLQNDLFNFFNNLNNFNNGEFLKQFNEENLNGKTIEEAVKKISDSITEYINELSPTEQQSFHELSKKLLDPSLSPNDKHNLVIKFKEDTGYISQQMEEILNQYVAGSNVDIERRKKLNEKFGIVDQEFLKQFNSTQLRIIDQLRTANKNENFNIYENLLNTDYGPQLIESLSTLEHDILEDPSIYGRAQQIMVKFFQDNFKLEPKEAYDTFYAMFGDIPEAAIEAAGDAFGNAKDLILTDPTKALTKKQSEEYQKLEATLGESLDYYKLINEEGEEYLSIAGRIAIFEKTAEKYENAILGDISSKLIQQKELKDINGGITEENKDQYDLLQKQIDLDKEKLKILEETREYTAQTTAALNNINYAEGYHKNIKAIKDAQKEMQRANAVLDTDTAKTLMSMGNGYIKYLNEKMIGENKYYTLTKENAELMMADQRKIYNEWIEQQRGQLDIRIRNLEAELVYFQQVANGEIIINDDTAKKKFEINSQELDDELLASEKLLEGELTQEEDKNEKTLNEAVKSATEFQNIWSQAYSNLRNEWNQLAEAMAAGEPTEEKPKLEPIHRTGSGTNSNNDIQSAEKPSDLRNSNNNKNPLSNNDYQGMARQQVDRINAALERLRAARDELEILGPDFDDTASGASKTADEMKKLTKVLEDCADALEKLDKLLKDVNNNLKDINVNYNPFTDLFEAWEKEWDYYYNIKRLIQEIETQGQYIDNIISADYISANNKLQARHAKIGNLTAAVSANDAYITALRTGMTQTGVELMQNYGQYYKINPETGQVYQTDKNLEQINNAINQARQELFDLQKLQNEKENNLALENAKLSALEEEKSAYEDILSTIESQIDSLSNDDDIIADISSLQSEKARIKASIEISDSSIDNMKDKIRGMEDEIQEIEIQITLNQQDLSKIEEYVDKMEDKVSEYEEYWENLNSTIAQQQELLQSLAEEQKYYIDTAVSVQQELYNAIVENYQDEINEKKAQYDQLKQLDNDYLRSVRDSINKEKQLREDSNKQRSYQQNIQRAQLLQMDTSGQYRSELASLNKEIQSQRQDLYDDLVNKQVEALQKEIENRHELYDKEVAALEERLAFMQENAILLWEKVNLAVASGTNEMMRILMNTTDYMSKSELEKERIRKEWETNTTATFDGIINNTITMLDLLIASGNEYINSINPEIHQALSDYIEVYEETREKVDRYNELLEQQNINAEAYGTAIETYYRALSEGKEALIAYNLALEAAGNALGIAAEEAGRKLGLSFDSISEELIINMQAMAYNLGVGMDDATVILNNKLYDIAKEFDTNIDIISDNLKIDFFSLGNDFLKIGEDYVKLNTTLMEMNTDIFKQIIDSFMVQWNDKSNKFTGYAQNWEIIVDSLKKATEENIQSLKDLNKNYEIDVAREMNKIPGSIGEFIDKIKETSRDMYSDFITERSKYRDELERIIDEIRSRISAAIQSAANAITGAANSVQVNPNNSSGSAGNSGNTGSAGSGVTVTTYKAKVGATLIEGLDNTSKTISKEFSGSSKQNIYSAAASWIESEKAAFKQEIINKWKKKFPYMNIGDFDVTSKPVYQWYKKGGLANFTGPAWLDGTKSNPERILSPRQTKLFESMVSSLEKTANNSTINSGFNSSYNIGEINTVIKVDRLDNQTDINKLAKQVEEKIVKDLRNRVSVSINKGV